MLGKRLFSSSASYASRIGRAPVSIPAEVNLRIIDPTTSGKRLQRSRIPPTPVVEIEGPLGKLSLPLPPSVTVDYDSTGRRALVKVQDATVRKQREMWGTTRAYLQNHVMGVSEGHIAILSMVGVGYRATVEPTATTQASEYPGQEFISLKVGFGHPVELGIPKGVKASTPQPTRILLEGTEREVVYSFAAKIRMWRKPEPYKGKGIFLNDQTIRLKAKKIK
ncbi:MAG: hypothetical protein M1823_002107 [Watsoniomyces obsoletus]|nr:MAG: hypothetical protein M1823_002107 [Watsoniomyces obsoletus]